MKCKKYQKFLSDYYDGSLSERKSNKIKRHLEQCSECKEILYSYKKLDEEVKTISKFEPSSNYWENYWSKLKTRIEKESIIKGKAFLEKLNWKWSFVGIMASVLIFVIIFTFLLKKREVSEEIYYPFSDQYLFSFINEIEENNFLAEYFKELIFKEIGSEIENLNYFGYSEDFNDIYSLLNEMSDEEKKIFNSEIIKELRNKGVKDEIQS